MGWLDKLIGQNLVQEAVWRQAVDVIDTVPVSKYVNTYASVGLGYL